MAEDIRQPPYLCPVELKKVLVAIEEGLGEGGNGKRLEEREIERYKALLEFCEGEEWVEVMMREYISTGECFCVWVGGLFVVGVGVGLVGVLSARLRLP